MVGISVNDTTQGTAVANLGWDEVRFPAPIFVGDTLRIETEFSICARANPGPTRVSSRFAHRAYNQHGELVAHCKRSSLQRKRPAANA
jgi:acyl dehydratase